MTLKDDNVPEPLGEDAVSRRKFLTVASAGMAGTVVTGRAAADTLADVPPREPGADFSGHSERSKYVQIARIPGGGPGTAQRRSERCDQFENATGQAGRRDHAHPICIMSAAMRACPIWILPSTGC